MAGAGKEGGEVLAGEDLYRQIARRLRTWPGARRYDLAHLFAQPAVYRGIVEAMSAPFEDEALDKVIGLESMGLTLAGAAAMRLGTAAASVRKEGRTPWGVIQEKCLDYEGSVKVLELAQDAVGRKERVLLVDDWAETGAQLKAASALVRRLGGVVVGAACIGIEPQVMADPDFASMILVSVLPPDRL